MMEQEQSPEFSLVDAGRELPTTGQVVGRAVWASIVLVALVLLAVVAATYLTAVPTWWWLLSVLAALLLALVLLKAIRVPRPRLRRRFARGWMVPVVRDAVARDRLPADEARQKAAGAFTCQDTEDFVLLGGLFLAVLVAIISWPTMYLWWPLIAAVGGISAILAPGVVRARKYLDLYHRES